MRLSNKIVLASMNPDKFREFQAILKAYPDVELVPAEQILRNPDKLGFAEKYETYLENSAAKARLVNHGSHYPALADDTGLECEALGGKPGVRSFRYAPMPAGKRSRAAQDEANRALLLQELSKAGGSRAARFVTTVSICIEGILVHASGTLEGTIAEAPRGAGGFGYDSIFTPKGSAKTLAEMTDSEKNGLSHRAKAVHELMAQLRARGVVFAKP